MIGLDSNELDITNQPQVTVVTGQHKPDLIINAAAYTRVDKVESNIKTSFAINEQGIVCLTQAADEADIPLFHISTDYVSMGKLLHLTKKRTLLTRKVLMAQVSWSANKL